MKSLAAVLVQAGRDLELMELDLPRLSEGQVLVDVIYSGACHTQVLEVRGLRGADPWCPHCLGHEAVGQVLETGAGVTRVSRGDKVVLGWIQTDGNNGGGVTYLHGQTKVNAGPVATFMTMCVASENRLTPLPHGVDPKLAVLLGCAAPTGMGSVINVAAAGAGQSLAVIGTGGVGLCAIAAAAAGGCDPVIAIDRVSTKLDLANALGATHCIDVSKTEMVESVLKIVPGGLDFAVEATGRPEVMAAALKLVRSKGGAVVIIGNAPYGSTVSLDPSAFNQGKRLLGTWGGDSNPARDTAAFAQILQAQNFARSGIVSAPYALSDINRALRDLEDGRIGRPLIDMSQI